MSKKHPLRETVRKKSQTPEQRARRTQSILFSLLAGVMIISMIVALLAR